MWTSTMKCLSSQENNIYKFINKNVVVNGQKCNYLWEKCLKLITHACFNNVEWIKTFSRVVTSCRCGFNLRNCCGGSIIYSLEYIIAATIQFSPRNSKTAMVYSNRMAWRQKFDGFEMITRHSKHTSTKYYSGTRYASY